MITQFEGNTLAQTNSSTVFDGYYPIPGEVVLESRSIPIPSIFWNMVIIIAVSIVLRIIAFLVLHFKLQKIKSK